MIIGLNGSFTPSFNDDTIKCYCFENGFAFNSDIESYKSEYRNSDYKCNKFGVYAKRKSIILHDLYEMNNIDMTNFDEQPIIKYFCSNVQPLKPISNNDIINNSSTTEINTNSITSSTLSKQALDDAKPLINSDEKINSKNYSTLFKKSTTNKIDILKDIETILKLLPEEDIALLNDMTNNNLNDPNILEYIKMSREEKLEFLNNKSKEKKPKVSLKKK